MVQAYLEYERAIEKICYKTIMIMPTVLAALAALAAQGAQVMR